MRHRTHAGDHAPATEGRTIRWASWYDCTVGLLTLGQGGRLRRRTIELAGIRAGDRVLDIGCGTADLTLAAARVAGAGGRVYGIDAAPEMIAVARRKAERARLAIELDVQAVEHLSFPDRSMNVVLSSLMMHHLPGDLKKEALREVYRVLKPGGRVLIVDLDRQGGMLNHAMLHLTAHGGLRIGIRELAALMRASGFVNLEAGGAGFLMMGYARGNRPDFDLAARQ